jgi:tetratricopeptide (TPR) repeat protein
VQSPEHRRNPGILRTLLFAGLVLAFVLGGGNAAIEWLERRGVVDTHRRDDVVQFVNEALFERDGPRWRTSTYAERSLVPASFERPKADGTWRAFMVGGSFLMGTPYVHQDHGEERPGGVGTWLREALRPASGGTIELINAAAGAANSQRVALVAAQALQLAPDVMIVASCNNEGEFPPGRVREVLKRQAGYRLLSQVLLSEPEVGDRPVYARQASDLEGIRAAWRARLDAIIEDAGARGVTVVLSTLPVNLRYDHTDGKAFERGFLDGSWYLDDEGQAPTPDPCVEEGIALYDAGEFDASLEVLQGCDDEAEAVRFAGLVLAAKGEHARALPLLEQAVELVPRNRCRPSFNDDIRALAQAHAHVVLADLDAAARRASPGGLPGSELFTDYCHMNWRGYALMAEELLDVMEGSGLLPAAPQRVDAERLVALRDAFRLQPLPARPPTMHGPPTRDPEPDDGQ